MLRGEPPLFIKCCWIATPIVSGIKLYWLLIAKTQQEFPIATDAIIAIMFSPLFIGLFAKVVTFLKARNLTGLFSSTEEWGPPDQETRAQRLLFNPRFEVRFRRRFDACKHRCLLDSPVLNNCLERELSMVCAVLVETEDESEDRRAWKMDTISQLRRHRDVMMSFMYDRPKVAWEAEENTHLPGAKAQNGHAMTRRQEEIRGSRHDWRCARLNTNCATRSESIQVAHAWASTLSLSGSSSKSLPSPQISWVMNGPGVDKAPPSWNPHKSPSIIDPFRVENCFNLEQPRPRLGQFSWKDATHRYTASRMFPNNSITIEAQSSAQWRTSTVIELRYRVTRFLHASKGNRSSFLGIVKLLDNGFCHPFECCPFRSKKQTTWNTSAVLNLRSMLGNIPEEEGFVFFKPCAQNKSICYYKRNGYYTAVKKKEKKIKWTQFKYENHL